MDDVVFFYSKEQNYFELSNFYPLTSPILYMDKPYPTSEHLYQALKFLLDPTPINLEYAEAIRTAKTPYMAKILGNQNYGNNYPWRLKLNEVISNHAGAKMISDWDNRKLEVMEYVLRLKFYHDPHCREILLSTGKKVLMERSKDPFWGIQQNNLGKLLMKIRDQITLSESSSSARWDSESTTIK